jgi:gliding motility-associated-like protein
MKQILRYCFLIACFLPVLAYADGNQSLGVSYSLTKCGLNFTQASVKLEQRNAPVGTPQPAVLNIAGIPAGAIIEKAFLYSGGSGNGGPQTATINGPLGTQNFPMTLIGTSVDKCWNYGTNPQVNGTVTYRADVTAAVNGNGAYSISGLLVNPGNPPGGDDMDGASLVVIYSDPSVILWEGTIVIADGTIVGNGFPYPVNQTSTMNFAAVCGPTTNSAAMMIVSDLQPNFNPPNGTITLNGTVAPWTANFWDYFQVNTPINAAQSNAVFNVNTTTTNPNDCFNLLFTGIYYQNSSCAVCVPPIVNLDSAMTPATCDKCNGTATVIATGSPIGYTYLWSTGDTTATVNNLCAGTYSVTVQSGPTVATATVTVTDLGHVFGLDSSVTNPLCFQDCNGHITVTPNGGTAPYVYSWIPNNIGNTQTVNNLCQGTYFVTVTDSFNCVTHDTFTLTHPPIVPGPNTYDVAYCQYETAVPLTAVLSNPAHTALWYTQPTGGTGTATAPVPSTATPGTFTWYVSEEDSTGCESSRVPANVIIKAKPLPPVLFSSEINYCQWDSAVQLYAVGDSLKWYTQPTGGSYVFVAPTPQTDVLGVFVWYVSQTVNGCESDRIPVTVGVYQKPEPPVTKDVVYCQGDEAAPLTAIGSDLRWYLLPQGGSAQPTPTPITTIPDTVIWYVASNNHGCESDRTPLKVITKYRPSVHILYSNDSVCQFDTLTYQYEGYALDSAIFAWEWPEGAVVVSGNDSTRGPIVVRFDSTGPKRVALTVTDNGCSSPRATVPVEVKVLPVVQIDLSNRNPCKDDTLKVGISYSNMGIKNYWWNFDGGITPWGSSGSWGADGGGPYYITWPTAGIHSLTVHVQGVDECYSRPDALDTVNIHDRPEAKIEPLSEDNICSGDSIRVSASTNIAGNSYEWTPWQFFDDGNNTSVVNAYIEFTRYIKLRVTNVYGCYNEDSVLVHTKPCCDISMPDAFSPNGDGKNDVFRIMDLGRHPLTDFRIFNRWGEIVFDTTDPMQGWDGSHEGVAQDMDVYYYIVKFKCDGKATTKLGQVTLIR